MRLNQQLSRVEIDSFELNDPLIFKYFNELPQDERDAALLDVIYMVYEQQLYMY